MNENIKAAAWELRSCIECNKGGLDTLQALVSLVQQLGGDREVILDSTLHDKPQLLVSYLLSLILTQE